MEADSDSDREPPDKKLARSAGMDDCRSPCKELKVEGDDVDPGYDINFSCLNFEKGLSWSKEPE